jgi:hypothetical protein
MAGRHIDAPCFSTLDWRVDDAGIIGFAIAPFGFLIWIISRSRLPSRKREEPSLTPLNAASTPTAQQIER